MPAATVGCCVLLHTAITIWLGQQFISFCEAQQGEPTDAVRHIELANEQREGNLTYIPHFYARVLIYHVTGIDAFPPSLRQLACYQLVNSLATGLLVLCLIGVLSKYLIPLTRKQRYLIWLCYYFSPGIFFLSATLRSEIFSFLFLCVSTYAVFAVKPSRRLLAVFLASCVGVLSRPTGIFFPWLAWLCKKLTIGTTLVAIFLMCSAVLSLTAVIVPGFMQGPHYLFTEYQDRLRSSVNISSLDQLWRIPLKLAVSLLLDAFSIRKWHEVLLNPEILNNIAATLRVFLFGLIAAISVWGKLDRKVVKILSLYLCYVAPLILFSGFYQTRYFIPADLMLVVAAVHLVGVRKTAAYSSRTAQL
jgi:hypothetical protein